MFPIKIDDHLELRILDTSHAEVLLRVLTDNRAHLDRWLRWSVSMQTLEDIETYLQSFWEKHETDNGFHAGIFYDGELVGGLVCHYINHTSNKSEIGYWLGEKLVGKGLVTKASLAVLKVLFEDKQLHRVEIQCGVENMRSRAVPERLGFVQEGIKRESEWVTTRYVDHVMYSMLSHEWFARN